ncbi:MAG: S1C family serine protease, partial [Stackebrandtia sp.]
AGSPSPSQLVGDGATLSDVAAAVQPSVVSINTGNGEGSGVVYDDEGHIITNNHVAATAAGGKMEVAFPDGSTAEATLVGADPAGDLAVIKVEGVDDLTPVTFGDSESLTVGDQVLALGSPLGLDGSVSAGIVSALDRSIEAGDSGGGDVSALSGMIQTDAAINQGNSGGALVNGRGELIGINTAIATADGSAGSVGVGFAIPSSTVADTVEQLLEDGSVENAYLGVGVADSTDEAAGAVVTRVEEGSPAEEAGLKRGDVIVSVDGEPISAASDVVAAVQGLEPGAEVEVTYLRDSDEEETADVTLGSAVATD